MSFQSHLQPARAISCGGHQMTGTFKVRVQQVQDVLIVFDDEYRGVGVIDGFGFQRFISPNKI
jgi:hypothetical protein